MLRLIRRWLMKQVGSESPVLRRFPGVRRSRFLAARFKDPQAPAALRWSLRRDLDYRLFLPSGSAHRDRLPLLVMLHGCTQDPLTLAEGTRMNTLAEERRFAVLYPQQSPRSNPQRCWNWFESASLAGRGEAAVIARLIDQVAARRAINRRRVYVAGMSAGGAMACILAVRHSRLFAACAIHSGLMYGAADSPLQALAAMQSGAPAASIARALRFDGEAGESEVMVPTLVIHGDRDSTVNPLNADRIIAQMRARAESLDPCAGALSASAERRIDGGGRSYRQQDYMQQGRLVLRKVLVEGLGHAWSGGDGRHEFNDADGPDASRLIVDFVMRYRREVRLAGAAAGSAPPAAAPQAGAGR
ncbi:MAG TPA: PHB depolymerase family esterase [Steroidobacteraceae bacterium]|nr:PHB depolymerase family esterase [Steroidobacteraceae bacterium]